MTERPWLPDVSLRDTSGNGASHRLDKNVPPHPRKRTSSIRRGCYNLLVSIIRSYVVGEMGMLKGSDKKALVMPAHPGCVFS